MRLVNSSMKKILAQQATLEQQVFEWKYSGLNDPLKVYDLDNAKKVKK